jgi:DNA segregation ATPase FtsK/SpoIIIE-like protein
LNDGERDGERGGIQGEEGGMSERDEIEAGADLTDAEIEAAKAHLRRCGRPDGTLLGCTSYLQRSMHIGYAHAGRIVDYLEAVQFVTPLSANGTRKLTK